MPVLGFEAKMYYQTDGAGGSAGWNLIDNVKDLSSNVSADEVEVTTRGGAGWKQFLAGLKDAGVSFDMVWDTGDAAFTAIKDAWLNGTLLGFQILDGANDADGSQGLQGDFYVTGFERTENVAEALMVNVTLKPAYSATAMTWLEVSVP